MACLPSGLRRPAGGPDCLPRPSVLARFPLGSLEFTATRPFPPPPGSDTIPIACRPAVQFNPFYPAGPALLSFPLLRSARRKKPYSFVLLQIGRV